MSRKILLLNLALLAVAGMLFWSLRAKWLNTKAVEKAELSRLPHPPALLPPPPPPALKPVVPADYADVAQKTLFSKDRNPNVIVDAPPPPPPPPPMPALPVYYGQMGFGGDPVVVLSTKAGEQKSYAVGDKIGEFKLVAFDHESIKFEWDDKEIVRKLADLAPKEPEQKASAPRPASAPARRTTDLAASPAASPSQPEMGIEMGNGLRGCKPGESSPPGTILDGYKKVMLPGLMGQTCAWQKVNQ